MQKCHILCIPAWPFVAPSPNPSYSNGMNKTGAKWLEATQSTAISSDAGHAKHKLTRDGIIKMLNGSVLLFPFFCMIIDVSLVGPVPTCLYVPN